MMHRCSWLTLTVLLTLAVSAPAGRAAGFHAQGLRCEYRAHPLGIDTPQPRLSWRLEASERGQRQTAYRVLAATRPKLLAEGKADLWDSGKVASSESVHVVYGGRPLRAGQRVYWKVRAWDRDGRASGYSEAAWWEMGLLAPADWQADWITRRRPAPLAESQLFADDPAPLLRKEFVVEKKIRRARIYVSGLGYYELRLNGRRVGDQVLDPGWTTYSQRVLYSTYDVTACLRRGRNAWGVMLGNGWFNPLPLRLWGHINPRENLTIGEPRVIAQLRIELADGTTQTLGTDVSWKTGPGPIQRNSVYLGEVYDARREQPGWDQPGFDDSNWEPAQTARGELGPLQAQDAPPIRVTRVLQPVKLTEPKPGVHIFDFGQNFAGWARLRVQGPAGTRVKLRYGELLYPDGTLNGMTAVCGQIKGGGRDYHYDGQGAPKTAWQMDDYILKGQGRETYTPRFTFHGFRYVEVTGYPGQPTLASLDGLRLNADVAPVGSFACSNEQFNRIQEMVLWTELSNLFSVQSDCPHREKFGYGGDIVASGEMALFNFDMGRFYAKAVRDLADAVRPNGGFTETAPFVGISDEGLGERSGPVGWGTAHPFLLWGLYQHYGDRRLLEENYGAARRWLGLLQSQARDGILDNGISDHESLVPKPRALTGTGFYYLNAQLLARLARVLGKDAEAAEAEALAETIKAAFNRRFLQPGTGRYDTATQACQAFALHLGLVPPEEKDRALAVLVRDIEETHHGHLSTGIFGTRFMLHALADLGRADTAFQVVNQRTFPGWGHMLENGATTLWEHWEFSDNTYSHNHPMFGSVSEWFYKVLAGINAAPDAAGFDRILIRPQPVGGLRWVAASYDSVRGKVVSEWRREGGQFKLHIRVPVGAVATVFVPARAGAEITEGGQPIARAAGVRLSGRENGSVVLNVAAGEYHFASPLE
ncbi:MAG: family 78 glycoside hydrolase catalytic domain [Verrucomicrobia bacterium]|nr:family 78 glycoside hydrolase catalytic domain [Verrucomicrobiota bacterium]